MLTRAPVMFARTRLFVPILLGISFVASTSLAAQRPQTRRAFWIGFGLGAGNLGWSCDGCSSENHSGPTGFLRLGGAPSQKVLLGAEINAWALDIGVTESGRLARGRLRYPRRSQLLAHADGDFLEHRQIRSEEEQRYAGERVSLRRSHATARLFVPLAVCSPSIADPASLSPS